MLFSQIAHHKRKSCRVLSGFELTFQTPGVYMRPAKGGCNV